MTVALISADHKEIVATYPGTSADINVPGKWQAFGVGVGWTSADGAYTLVAVAPFAPPAGKVTTGSPTYSFDGDGNVAETFAVTDAPPAPPPSVPNAVMLGRLTDGELAAIEAAATQNVQMARWLEMARVTPVIDLTATSTVAAKAGLVAAGLLTQDRADAVFAPG
jgi:hypothetical protein